jgi:serine protease AprX
MNTLGSANRAHDAITSYTSKGPTLIDHVVKPDLVAPGNLIISLYRPWETLSQLYSSNEIPTNLYQWNGNSSASGTYFMLSGTSMAAPMVSGAAALLLQQSPYMTPDQVKARLMKTAYKSLIPYNTVTVPPTGAVYNEQADIFTVGAGLLDIQAALSNTSLAPWNTGSALSPTAAQDTAGNTVMLPGSSAVWGQSVMWGTSVVWGSTVFDGTDASGESVLWGDSAPWGSSSIQGSSVLWGDSVLWGSSVLWGDSVLWGSSTAAGDPASPAN